MCLCKCLCKYLCKDLFINLSYLSYLFFSNKLLYLSNVKKYIIFIKNINKKSKNISINSK